MSMPCTQAVGRVARTPDREAYRLDVLDGHVEQPPTTVTLCMSRDQALAMAYRLNRYLAEMADPLVVLPIGGNLIFE